MKLIKPINEQLTHLRFSDYISESKEFEFVCVWFAMDQIFHGLWCSANYSGDILGYICPLVTPRSYKLVIGVAVAR